MYRWFSEFAIRVDFQVVLSAGEWRSGERPIGNVCSVHGHQLAELSPCDEGADEPDNCCAANGCSSSGMAKKSQPADSPKGCKCRNEAEKLSEERLTRILALELQR